MAEIQRRSGQAPSPLPRQTTPSWARSMAISATAWIVDVLVAWSFSDNRVSTCANGGRDNYYIQAFIFTVPLSVLALCAVVPHLRAEWAARNHPAVITRATVALAIVLGVLANFVVVAQIPMGICD